MILQAKWNKVRKIGIFGPIYRFISETVQYMAIFTMENKEELVCDLTNVSLPLPMTLNDL